MKNCLVKLPDDLHGQMRAYCFLNGLQVQEFVLQLIKKEVGEVGRNDGYDQGRVTTAAERT